MATVHVAKEIETMLHALASKTGLSEENIVREAIMRFFEDLEDVALLEAAEKNPGKTYTLEEVRRELGLED